MPASPQSFLRVSFCLLFDDMACNCHLLNAPLDLTVANAIQAGIIVVPKSEKYLTAITSGRAVSRPYMHKGPPTHTLEGRDRSALSRERVFRSERSRAGQVRDAAKRPAGGSAGGGGSSGRRVSRPVFYVTQELFEREGLLGLLPRKRGPKRPHKLNDEALLVLAQAVQSAEGREDAQGRGTRGASGATLWRRGTSAEHLAAATSVSPAGGKKTPMAVDIPTLDAGHYSAQYELLRPKLPAPCRR